MGMLLGKCLAVQAHKALEAAELAILFTKHDRSFGVGSRSRRLSCMAGMSRIKADGVSLLYSNKILQTSAHQTARWVVGKDSRR